MTPNQQGDRHPGDGAQLVLLFAALWTSFFLGAVCGALR